MGQEQSQQADKRTLTILNSSGFPVDIGMNNDYTATESGQQVQKQYKVGTIVTLHARPGSTAPRTIKASDGKLHTMVDQDVDLDVTVDDNSGKLDFA